MSVISVKSNTYTYVSISTLYLTPMQKEVTKIDLNLFLLSELNSLNNLVIRSLVLISIEDKILLEEEILKRKKDLGSIGKSAYELAVDKGFIGTLDEYLISLCGKDGSDGIDGINGENGKDGVDGKDGTNGIDGVNGSDSVIEFYNAEGVKPTKQVKFWSGRLTTDSNGYFKCNYSNAGFTEVPSIWANGIPKSGVAGQQIFVSCDVKNATKTECSGYISSSTVAVVLVAGALDMPTSDLIVYAMGI